VIRIDLFKFIWRESIDLAGPAEISRGDHRNGEDPWSGNGKQKLNSNRKEKKNGAAIETMN
jgi:hypothetical protein